MKTLYLSALLVLLTGTYALCGEPTSSVSVPKDVQATLKSYCNDCHGADTAEGGVRFDNLEELDLEGQINLLNRAQDQLFFGLMPPEEAEQPAGREQTQLTDWLRRELRRHNASQLDARLPYLGNGNLVDHEQLFSGEITEMPYTPARRWRVSPQIFHERVIDLFQLTGRERDFYSKHGRSFYGVTNPFVLPERSGVRDFDLSTLDGGHLLVMLDNAKWIAEKQIHRARVLNKELEVNEFPNAKDRWLPPSTPEEFEIIILNDSLPSDEEIVDAIRKQFELVLQRPATESEVDKYLELTGEAIQLGGNTAGLQEMLAAVLLESEFLYRLEFGEGPLDEYGRMKLSPREASLAIAYALGDRSPDTQLVEAAQQGRLTTREDYRREVTRLLNDEEYFRGQIDSSLNGKHYKSNETSHPRIVRFFRDFFGYPAALKVFKDGGRSEGKYMNPDRGSQGTPGWLILEADRIVTRHIEQDENVFENLLTFDEFFVYHDKDDETGRKIIEEWRDVYETLKETDWKNDPQRVLDDNLEFLKAHQSMRIKDNSKPGELVNFMHYFEESFGQGRNPFTTVPWAHGYYFHHAPFYNLPPTPVIGRYGSWKSSKYVGDLEPKEFWDYPPEQPFKIENRKGILTHPAWLIAHSSNFHTDPIKRGRWVRENLLAGCVPDVPITVDAQVPEDPHKTFRQRVEMVTQESECWKCHKQMNPLGLAFEAFDDFGRFRTEEALEDPENLIQSGNGKSSFDVYKTAPVVSNGKLVGTGDPELDGDVDDAFDLIERLAKSERVRQSIIRHAFRFYLGRNEMLSDSQTLIDADRAYVESGGSFKAVIISLLTSDSFMYRKSS
ncbi:DUF1588 domain-containing protein [Bremerella sp. P1]|uniref:DUF1588 domain-containing protein n=1 Tax=Bremerella sp. P1 TaxID=3026424 RepID=UPI002367B9C8|nr:DUF1588 domain-containing protein [Bremerella sp. P1]WDI41985.1 DUF1588 domain-containing protein [Bremerella sp. P1]